MQLHGNSIDIRCSLFDRPHRSSCGGGSRATDEITYAVQSTKDIESTVAAFDTSTLKNSTMQNALLNKLNAVLADIKSGNYAAALDQLQNDILIKTDGCATIGAPDRNDWLKTCKEQDQLYPLVVNLIAFLKNIK